MADDNTGSSETQGSTSDSTTTASGAGAEVIVTTTGTDDLASLKEALSKERQLRRDAEKRAKDGATYKTRLDELTQAQMSEQEKAVAKAVAEAEANAKSTVLGQTATRLARAELRAAAAGRVEQSALDGFLDYADLQKFVGDDGEPDTKAIKAAVDKLAGPQRTNFDGGARSNASKTTDMNQLIRDQAFGR